MVSHNHLHTAIIRGFVDHGRAPTVPELVTAVDADESGVRTALDVLATEHGVVLHPDAPDRDDPVWVAHPFAAAPSGATVHHDQRVWLAPCVWCAFGVVGLVAGDGTAEVRTTLGGEGDQVRLATDGDRLLADDFVVHFPIPMVHAWDNVVHTCQVMQLFADPDDVAPWCERHGVALGSIEPVTAVWAFSREWYGRHADTEWRKWTTDEAAEIFARHGFSGPTWDLPDADERF